MFLLWLFYFPIYRRWDMQQTWTAKILSWQPRECRSLGDKRSMRMWISSMSVCLSRVEYTSIKQQELVHVGKGLCFAADTYWLRMMWRHCLASLRVFSARRCFPWRPDRLAVAPCCSAKPSFRPGRQYISRTSNWQKLSNKPTGEASCHVAPPPWRLAAGPSVLGGAQWGRLLSSTGTTGWGGVPGFTANEWGSLRPRRWKSHG